MNTYKIQSFGRTGQDGVAMIEFAIIAPILIAFCLSTYDLGRALTHHLTAVQIAREGVRKAIATPGLEKGRYTLSESGGLTSCSAASPSQTSPSGCSSSPNQSQLLTSIYRTQLSLENQEGSAITPGSRVITVEYGVAPSATTTVTVRVGFAYQGMSLLFNNAPVGASLSASYL